MHYRILSQYKLNLLHKIKMTLGRTYIDCHMYLNLFIIIYCFAILQQYLMDMTNIVKAKNPSLLLHIAKNEPKSKSIKKLILKIII